MEDKLQNIFVKVAHLWDAYKKRMGTTTNPTMQIDLENYTDITTLITYPSRSQGRRLTKQQPKCLQISPQARMDSMAYSSRSVGMHIIKEDIYNLCKEFFEGNLNLKAINNSFITLIPKCNNPSSVNDFRPISLLNSVLKLLTKIMSGWLQRVIIPLVHQNQYGFIKNR